MIGLTKRIERLVVGINLEGRRLDQVRSFRYFGSLGRNTLTSQERACARFQIVSVLGKEVWAHAIYTRDERRTFCAWVVFLAKTGGTQS